MSDYYDLLQQIQKEPVASHFVASMATNPIHLKTGLSELGSVPEQRSALFALLSLSILDSLTSGLLSATDTLQFFFHAENCLFVHQHLHSRNADEIVSHGVQLPDLFDILSPAEAQREF